MRFIAFATFSTLVGSQLGCAAAPTNHHALAKGQLELLELAPATGDALGRSSVITATVRYSITGFDPADTYVLVPLFNTKNPDETFNELPGFRDGFPITSPEGDISVSYAIAKEWDSGRLAQPIVVHFVVLELTAKHKATAIATTPSLTFTATE
jgi:hypothetical protein